MWDAYHSMLLQQRVINHKVKAAHINHMQKIKCNFILKSIDHFIIYSELDLLHRDSLRLQLPFHLSMDGVGSKSAISGLCCCIVIKSVTMVSLSLLLQSDLITLVRLNPRSQSALLAGKDSNRSTSWSTFGQESWAFLNTSTHSGSLGGTLAFREYLKYVPVQYLSLTRELNLHYILEQIPFCLCNTGIHTTILKNGSKVPLQEGYILISKCYLINRMLSSTFF